MGIAVLSLALLFFVGHGLRYLFIQTKIPDLLILVAIGYLAGPVFGVIQASDLGKVGSILSTMALVVILYEGGLELRAKDLIKSMLPASGLAILGFTLIVSLATFFAYTIAAQELTTALLFGLAMGCTSAAIVIPMTKQLSMSKEAGTIVSLEAAFTDVLTIILFLVIVDSVGSGEFDINKLLYGIGPKSLISIGCGALSALIWAYIQKRFSFVSEMTFAGEAWALLTYGLIELPHYNGVLGVFSLGFTLANLDLFPYWFKKRVDTSPVSPKDLSLLSELTFLLRTFFFLYLGLLSQFNNIKIVLFATFIAVVIAVTRYLAVRIVLRPSKFSRIDAMITMALGPRGLATAVLATIPLQKGIAGGQWIQDTLFALIPITILSTAIFIFLSENATFRTKAERLFAKYNEDQLPETKTKTGLPAESS